MGKVVVRKELDPEVRAFGLVIQWWRRRRKLSPEGLAARAGLARQTVPNIEKGWVDPKLGTQLRLARALRVSLVRLVTQARRRYRRWLR